MHVETFPWYVQDFSWNAKSEAIWDYLRKCVKPAKSNFDEGSQEGGWEEEEWDEGRWRRSASRAGGRLLLCHREPPGMEEDDTNRKSNWTKRERGRTNNKPRAVGCWRKLESEYEGRESELKEARDLTLLTCERPPHWQTAPWSGEKNKMLKSERAPTHLGEERHGSVSSLQLTFCWPEKCICEFMKHINRSSLKSTSRWLDKICSRPGFSAQSCG